MSAQIKAEFQLIEAKANNAYSLPVGTVFARLFIPVDATLPGLKLKGRILSDSWQKGAYAGTRKFRILEFVAPAEVYQAIMAHCQLSNMATNRQRTKELAERLFKSQMQAVKSTPAATPKKGTKEYDRKWQQLVYANRVDAWTTKPLTVEPFSGNAYSVDSPWVDSIPATVVESVQETAQTPAADSLVTDYADLLAHLTMTNLRRVKKAFGQFTKGTKTVEVKQSLARSLANATRKGNVTLAQVASYIRSL